MYGSWCFLPHCFSPKREIYNSSPQLIMEQLFNAPLHPHHIPWKGHDTLVIRRSWGKPNRSSEDMPVVSLWKDMTREPLAEKTSSTRQGNQNNKDTPKGKEKDVFLSELEPPLGLCVECSLTGIFMVKPVSKGNLSPNTTPQETVKIKHGGLGERVVSLQVRAFWSGISCPMLKKGCT